MKELQKDSVSTIIGSSDGPTSVFIFDGHKRNFKQEIHKSCFLLRQKWYALWIKPGTHTMEEVASYIKEKYHFVELSKESEEYHRQYEELRTSFIVQYRPELLGEYAAPPELTNKDEEGVRAFLAQLEFRRKKAAEIPEEVFSLDYRYFENEMDEEYMQIQLESHFAYIGGSASGKKISKFHKIYKDIYKYYGVSEGDIANNTERYQSLLRILAQKH